MVVRVSRSCALALCWLLSAGSAVAAPSKAAVTQSCLDANEQAQQLREQKKFVEAREKLLICSQDQCPKVVARDCITWQRELEALQPSVTFSAKDGTGRDATDVRVSMDGTPLVSSLDGTAVAVDPGPHVFEFERDGESTLRQEVVVNEGEKARKIAVSFKNDAAGEPLPKPASSAGAAPYVVAGVGAAGLITGLVLFAHGNANFDGTRCRDGFCAPGAGITPGSPEELEWVGSQQAAKNRSTWGLGIALGSTAVLAGGVVWILVDALRGEDDAANQDTTTARRKPPSPRIVPLIGPGSLGLTGTF